MKTCIICSVPQPISEYYAHLQMADGRLGKCKSCCKKQQRERETLKKSDINWLLSERERHRIKSRRASANGTAVTETNDQARKRIQKYRESHPERKLAHSAVGHAVRDGRLKKQPCEFCGKKKVQAHHPDYSKPLDVRWLCVKHHAQVHVEERINQLKAA